MAALATALQNVALPAEEIAGAGPNWAQAAADRDTLVQLEMLSGAKKPLTPEIGARAGQLINNVTYEPFRVYGLVAVLYFAICWPMSLLAARLEGRLDVRRQR